jgi:Domain of unknown function (DUF4062)
MARPRIFVSSTYYDLKHIRSSLEIFIQSLGYDSILSEKGDIAYTADAPLDESCYREAQNSDIYVLIVGGRYGSEISETKSEAAKDFYDRYESITKQEYKSAAEKDIPIYVLIEKAVHSEFQTFRKNRENSSIKYAHVDSINIFHFIEEILGQTRNNPVHTFDKHAEIEVWLKEQWAGLFRELIQRMSSQQQLTSLSAQVSGLAEINKTLKRYLEALLVSEVPNTSKELISNEEKRLKEANKAAVIGSGTFLGFLNRHHSIDPDVLIKFALEAASFNEFLEKVAENTGNTRILNFRDSTTAEADFLRSLEVLTTSEPQMKRKAGNTLPTKAVKPLRKKASSRLSSSKKPRRQRNLSKKESR